MNHSCIGTVAALLLLTQPGMAQDDDQQPTKRLPATLQDNLIQQETTPLVTEVVPVEPESSEIKTSDSRITQPSAKPQMLTFVGKIVDIPTEGGFYGIVTQDGSRLLPLNLPVMFHKADLQVRGVAMTAPDVLGIHMWGQYVRLQNLVEMPCSPKVIVSGTEGNQNQ